MDPPRARPAKKHQPARRPIDSFEKYTQPHSSSDGRACRAPCSRFGLATSDVDSITEAAMLHDIGLFMSPAYHALPRALSFEARLDLWRHPVIGDSRWLNAMRCVTPSYWCAGIRVVERIGLSGMLAFEDIRSARAYCGRSSFAPRCCQIGPTRRAD